MINTISNRDLLRNYKMLKMKLSSGEIDALHIPQDDGSIIQMTMIKPTSRKALLLEKIKQKSFPTLTRPDVDFFE